MTGTRGRLIALEGIDGCGKSTQAALLADRLDAVSTFEPGATPLGGALRALLLGTDGAAVAPRAEALLMAAHFDPATRRRTRTFELFRHLALPDALLRVTGELKIETVTAGNGNGGGAGEEEEEEQTAIKLFVTGLESLEDFQGKGFHGAVVKLPRGEYPDRLLPLLQTSTGATSAANGR